MTTAGRMIGVDYGRARMGIAVCDALGISVQARGFIPRRNDAEAARTLSALIRQEDAVAVVIGLPLHAHGDEGENVRWVRAFARQLAAFTTVPIFEVDERHSSQEAEEQLRSLGKWPAAPGAIDAQAAAILLRRYLDGER